MSAEITVVANGQARAVAPGTRVRDVLDGKVGRDVVAVSPIIAGAALKGPADRLLAELGHEPTVVGVARLYADVVGTLLVDEADSASAGADGRSVITSSARPISRALIAICVTRDSTAP